MKNIGRRYEASADLTIFTVVGQVTYGEIEKSITEFYEGVTTRNVLWDLTRGNFELISKEDIQNLARIPKSQYLARKGGKSALVANKDLAYGMARTYEAQSEVEKQPFETRVFRSMEDALQWIGLPGSTTLKSPVKPV